MNARACRLAILTWILLGMACSSEPDWKSHARAWVDDFAEGFDPQHDPVLRAMATLPRHRHYPDVTIEEAYRGLAPSLPSGARDFSPNVLASMIRELKLERQASVLVIGAESSYTLSLVAELASEVWVVRPGQRLTSIATPLLRDFGYRNIQQISLLDALQRGAESPYEAILFNGSTDHYTEALVDTLADRGRMLIPLVENEPQLILLERQGDRFETRAVRPFDSAPELSGWTPPPLELPIRSSDLHIQHYGIWPYGVHGGGHLDGHTGIDFELQASSPVLATQSGRIVHIAPNPGQPDQLTLTLQVRAQVAIQYDHVVDVSEGLQVGSWVRTGTRLAAAAVNMDGFYMVHFGVIDHGQPLCPLDAFSPSARQAFDRLFERARYGEKLSEPLPCQTVDRSFPIRTRWKRANGPWEEWLEVTKDAPDAREYTYRWLNSEQQATEEGQLIHLTDLTQSTLDFKPRNGAERRLHCDFRGRALLLSTPEAPQSVATYRLQP